MTAFADTINNPFDVDDPNDATYPVLYASLLLEQLKKRLRASEEHERKARLNVSERLEASTTSDDLWVRAYLEQFLQARLANVELRRLLASVSTRDADEWLSDLRSDHAERSSSILRDVAEARDLRESHRADAQLVDTIAAASRDAYFELRSQESAVREATETLHMRSRALRDTGDRLSRARSDESKQKHSEALERLEQSVALARERVDSEDAELLRLLGFVPLGITP